MNTIKLTDEELEFVVQHIITFARLDGIDPVWQDERTHSVVVGKLMQQTPEAILAKILEEECRDYTEEQRARMIREAKGASDARL